MINDNLLKIIACPSCKQTLEYKKEENGLLCNDEGYLFPVRDGIPVLLIDEAKTKRK